MLYDSAKIVQALRLLLAPGQVTELRILDGRRNRDARPAVWSGYFDDVDAVVAAVDLLRGGWEGVYFTPNPCLPELLDRRRNRIDWSKRGESTTDAHIVARRWLLVDVDPTRPKGISSTDAQHALALERARSIAADLLARGWPSPIVASSGNGAHLLWRIDLPAQSDLPARLLHALAARWNDDDATVDPSVSNPSRIWKLYGTQARKGDASPERPHRLAEILQVPAQCAPVPAEALEAIIALYQPAAAAPRPAAPAQAPARTGGEAFDPVAFAVAAGLELDDGRPHPDGGTIYPLRVCACERKLTDRAAFLAVPSSGAVGLGCRHATCKCSSSAGTPGEHWKRFRAEHEAPAPIDRAEADARASTWAAAQAPAAAPDAPQAAQAPVAEPQAKRKRKAPQQAADDVDLGGFTDNADAAVDAPAAEPPPPDGTKTVDGRLLINVEIDLRDLRDKVLAVMAQAVDLYTSAGLISRVSGDGMSALSVAALDSVAVDLCQFVNWKRTQAGNWEARPAHLPPRVLSMLADLSPAQAALFRQVVQVTRAPFFAPDGEPVTHPGYNAAAQQLLIASPPVRLDAEPNAGWALGYLRDLVCDFPFEGEAEASNWIGALVSIVARPMIDGPMPLLLVEANKPGSGKTLLAKLIQVVCGLSAEVGPLPREERALASLLLSILLEGRPVHVFDNVKHAVTSASLDMVLTSNVYTDRILGKSKVVSCPVRQLWILTVNNGRLSQDMARRIVRVRLRDDTGAPEERTGFRHGDLLAYAKANRGEILSRVCQMVAEWVDAGQPEYEGVPRLGSFESWSRVVGNVMRHAGDEHFLTNLHAAKESATLDDGWEPFVVAWARELPTSNVKAGTLVGLCVRHDLLADTLGPGTEGSQASRLGHALRQRRDQILHGYRLTCSKDERTRQSVYGLQRVAPDAPATVWH